MDWRNEMNKMLAAFERQAMQSLRNIKMALNGQSFKPKFREYFLRASNNRLADTFDQFEMNPQMDGRMFDYTGSTTSTHFKSESNDQSHNLIEIDDPSDEEFANGSERVQNSNQWIQEERKDSVSSVDSLAANIPKTGLEQSKGSGILVNGTNNCKPTHDDAPTAEKIEVKSEINDNVSGSSNGASSGALSANTFATVIQIDDSDGDEALVEIPKVEPTDEAGTGQMLNANTSSSNAIDSNACLVANGNMFDPDEHILFQNDELAARKSHRRLGDNMNKNTVLETGASNESMRNVQNQNDSADFRRRPMIQVNLALERLHAATLRNLKVNQRQPSVHTISGASIGLQEAKIRKTNEGVNSPNEGDVIETSKSYEAGIRNGIKNEADADPKDERMEDDIPLVVEEVNPKLIATSNKQEVGRSDLVLHGGVASLVNDNITTGLNVSNNILEATGKKSAPMRSKPKKQFSCTVREYVSCYKANLNQHMRIHTGEKPYGCDRCGKGFTRAHTLKKHSVTHDFPFHCKGCFSGFFQKTEKEAHDKVCSNRRYESHLCKKFVTPIKAMLKMHMRKHTGEKPFRCEICIKQFNLKQNLRRHLNTIHTRINS